MGKKSEKTIAEEKIRRLWEERDKKMNRAGSQRERKKLWKDYAVLLGEQWNIIFAYNAKRKKTKFHERVAKDRKVIAMHPRRA